MSVTRIHWDTETTQIFPGLQAPPIVCMQWCDSTSEGQVIHRLDTAFPRYLRWFLESCHLDGHNLAYDMACVCAYDPELTPLVFQAYWEDRLVCTEMRETLIRIGTADSDKMTNLRACLDKRAPDVAHLVDKEDPYRLTYGQVWNVPVAQWEPGRVKYAKQDVDPGQRSLYQAQERHLDLLDDQFRKSRTAFWIRLMECWGITTGSAQVEKYHAQVLEGLRRDKATCQEHGLADSAGKKNTKPAKELLTEVYTKLGKEIPRTDTGEVCMDKDACRNSFDERLIAYSSYSRSSTTLTKVAKLRHPLIQASFDPLKVTGRTGCSEGGKLKKGEIPRQHGMQLQNLKKKGGLRECFQAPPGWAFISVDYDTFELRGWAQVCLEELGMSELAKVLNAGRDPHTELGAVLAGISIAEAYARAKGERGEDVQKHFKDLVRQPAKNGNFSLPGGCGPERFVEMVYESSEGELLMPARPDGTGRVSGEEVRDAWRIKWPEAPEYFRLMSRKCGDGKNGVWKAKRSGLVRAGMGFTDICNFPFQSRCASAATDAGMYLAHECYVLKSSPLYGCRIPDFIHDEFLILARLEQLHEAAIRQTQIQIEVAQTWIPDVTITATPSASYIMSKEAKTLYDSQGRLIPWEPKAAA